MTRDEAVQKLIFDEITIIETDYLIYLQPNACQVLHILLNNLKGKEILIFARHSLKL